MIVDQTQFPRELEDSFDSCSYIEEYIPDEYFLHKQFPRDKVPVDADGDLRVSQEKSATKESLWDIVVSTLLFPKIKLFTGVILNLVEEYLHHVTEHEPLIKESFLFGKDYGNCYCEFWGCDNGHICPRDL
jgi:hypothetical protein